MNFQIKVACVVLMAIAASTPAFGMAGLLKEPGLSLSAPASTRLSNVKTPENVKRLLSVLRSKKQKFVGGYFVNWETHLYYAGETSKLDQFLDDLATAGGRIHLHFSKKVNGTRLDLGGEVMDSDPAQWEVAHDPNLGEDRFDVIIFLGDGKIDLEKLHLPEMRQESR